MYKKEKKEKRKETVIRPEALAKSISPFKVLDRIFKPYYVLTIQHPNESRNVVITTMSMYAPKFMKKCTDVASSTQDVTIRRYFENVIKKPDYVMKPMIHVGTVEGIKKQFIKRKSRYCAVGIFLFMYINYILYLFLLHRYILNFFVLVQFFVYKIIVKY